MNYGQKGIEKQKKDLEKKVEKTKADAAKKQKDNESFIEKKKNELKKSAEKTKEEALKPQKDAQKQVEKTKADAAKKQKETTNRYNTNNNDIQDDNPIINLTSEHLLRILQLLRNFYQYINPYYEVYNYFFFTFFVKTLLVSPKTFFLPMVLYV